METKKLPESASLDQLRSQAKELRRAHARGNPAAAARVRAVRPEAAEDALPLREAQLVIAREYGFDGWRDLAQAVVQRQSGGRDLHRWFAVELNNDTWDQLDEGLCEDSTPAEREQALYAAYASTYHWMQAGNVANHGRGEYLVAAVATATGLLDVAARHAARYAGLIDEFPNAFADWDRAFAAEALARIAARSGSPDAAQLKEEARRLAEAVAEAGDREVCVDRLAASPWQPLDR